MRTTAPSARLRRCHVRLRGPKNHWSQCWHQQLQIVIGHTRHANLYRCFDHQNWPNKELVVLDSGSKASPFFTSLSDPRVDPIPPHINRPSRPCKMTNKNLHLSSPILAGHPRKNTPFEHFEVDIFHFFARLRRAGRIGRTRPRPTHMFIYRRPGSGRMTWRLMVSFGGWRVARHGGPPALAVAHGDHTPTLRSGLELSQGDHTPTLRYNPLV